MSKNCNHTLCAGLDYQEKIKLSIDEPHPWNNNEYSILMGNGVILSHPKVGEHFKFNSSDIKAQLENTYNSYPKKFNPDCPEDFMNAIRILSLTEILNWYIEQFKKNKNEFLDLEKFTTFVNKFKNIFTLNYDPIAYWSIFDQGAGPNFNDGFGKERMSVEEIKTRVKDNGLYFLHGAFHLIYHYEADNELPKDTHFYEKIRKPENKELLKETQDRLERIIKNYYEDQDPSENNKEYEDIFCVMESRPMNKKAWIENDPYLHFCLNKLKKQSHILTIGCSFAKDDHILEAMLSNEELEKLIIGVFHCADIENAKNAYERIKDAYPNKNNQNLIEENWEDKVSFCCTKNLKDVLWEAP